LLHRTIPIVFGVTDDPVKFDLVTSLARPGGNATGINWFAQETTAKRLGLLHEMVPKAVRIAVLVNPANALVAEVTLRDIPEAARAPVLKTGTSREIEAAFATTLGREPADALFVGNDAFFNSDAFNLRCSRCATLFLRSMPIVNIPRSDGQELRG